MAELGKIGWNSSTKPHPTGKAHVRGPNGSYAAHQLVTTDGGVAPAATHPGLRPVPQPNINRAARARCGTEAAPPVRRHIDPTHVDLSDAAKRAEGRLGKAHVAATEEQRRRDAYYGGGGQAAAVEQPPGAETNLQLKSYAYTPVGAREGGLRLQAGAGARGPLSAARNSTLTSVQLAEARLRRLQRERPEHRAAAAALLAQHRGAPSIVGAEQRLTHDIEAADYAKGSAARVEAIRAGARSRDGDRGLGRSTAAIEGSIPYALDESRPRADNVSGFGSGIAVSARHNAESVQPPPREREVDLRLFSGPAPYDSALVSAERYPEPPAVGVSQSFWQRPPLVRYDARSHAGRCSQDRDTIAAKRARAHQREDHRGTGDSIVFGATSGASPVKSPRPLTLRQRTEAGWRRQETQQQERRTGVRLCEQSYKETRLW